jgi:hypothetical protein
MGAAERARLWKVVALVAGAATIWIFAWNISAHQAQHSLAADSNAESYAGATQARIARACSGGKAPAVLECVAEQVEASREDQRAEYDLSAQNRMADWAFLTMLWGFATTIISGLALWFLKGTLDATREAVADAGDATQAMKRANEISALAMEHAREAFSNEMRPWLSMRCRIDFHQLGTTQEGMPGAYFEVVATIENRGSSAAAGVQFFADIALWTSTQTPESFTKAACERWEKNSGMSDVIFPGDPPVTRGHIVFLPFANVDEARKANEIGFVTPLIVACVNYKGAHISGVRQTRLCYLMVRLGPQGQAMAIDPAMHGWWLSIGRSDQPMVAEAT